MNLNTPLHTILIIEDEPDYVHLVALILERQGYQVRSSTGGEAALRLLEEAHREGQPGPDLILCDLRIQDADGTEIFRRTRAMPAYRTTPFVIMTGAPSLLPETGDEFDAVLKKPFTKDALLEVVTRLLSGQS